MRKEKVNDASSLTGTTAASSPDTRVAARYYEPVGSPAQPLEIQQGQWAVVEVEGREQRIVHPKAPMRGQVREPPTV
jgi:hypothetical protein